MARAKTIYRCSQCGGAEPKWAGRCSACEAWNTLVEERDQPSQAAGDERFRGSPATPVPIAEVLSLIHI